MEKNTKENDDYTFLQEQIKDRPINKKRLFRQSLTTILLAVIFGLVACVTFMLLEPVIEKWITPAETEKEIPEMTLPEEKEEIRPENMIQDEEELEEPDESDMEATQAIISEAIAKVEVGISDYQLIYDKLNKVAAENRKSLVTVTSFTEDVSWLSSVVMNEKNSYGLIVGDNGQEIFILAETGNLRNASGIQIRFCDGTTVDGAIKGIDSGTGFAIVAVDRTLLDENIYDRIALASLANSNLSVNNGDIVMAVGNTMGNYDSVGYGVVIACGVPVQTMDHNYKLIATDIYGSRNAEGFLINSNGQVIGVIDQSFNSPDMSNQITGLGISELRVLIEALSNQTPRSYMGLYLSNVTEEVQKQFDVPSGVFVDNIAIDSPALNYGIRKGDVIIAINDAVIGSVNDYETELSQYLPGDAVVVTVMRTAAEGYVEMNNTVILADMPGGIK